jgi:hypothetical protein
MYIEKGQGLFVNEKIRLAAGVHKVRQMIGAKYNMDFSLDK